MVKIPQKIISIVLHVLPWLLLLIGPFSSNFFAIGIPKAFQFWAVVIFVTMICTFYLNFSILIPRLLFKQRFWVYGLSVVLTLALATLLDYFGKVYFLGGKPTLTLTISGQTQTMIPGIRPAFAPVGLSLLLAVGLAIRLTARWLEQDRANREITQEQLQMELSLLKNQISPHFFFNTLNNVYSLAGSDSERAREVILKLSRIMRYLIYETESSKQVSLGREISLLNDYIELNRIRLPEQVEISFDRTSLHDDLLLPPLLFIPFVENAFKHGISLQQPSRIEISLNLNGDAIEFSVINTKHAHSDLEVASGGLGLVNIRRRLELIFGPEKFTLEIEDGEKIFEVFLKIPAYENQLHSSR